MRYCVYCCSNDWCTKEEQTKLFKCQGFRGNLDYSLKIRIGRFIHWIRFPKHAKIREIMI